MSIAANITALPETSTTVRQFRYAVLAAFAAIACACLIYILEKYIFDVPRRFVESPADVMVRAFGTAHFLVGWLFLFTSTRLYTTRALGRLGVGTLLGVAGCVAFALGGALRNPLLVMAFYSLFLVHEVRDQADLFVAYGDGQRCTPGVLAWFRRAVCLLLLTVLGSAFLVNGLIFDRHAMLSQIDPLAVAGGLLLPGLLTLFAFWKLGREAVREHGSLAEFANIYRPLGAVYASILVILVLGSLLGSVGFNLIILIHVTSWLVFVSYRNVARRSASWGARAAATNIDRRGHKSRPPM
jgi:hypothetical protein